jgi:hypothetical protein
MNGSLRLCVQVRCGFVVFTAIAAAGCGRIPDDPLIRNFIKNEAAFIRLRDLFAADPQLTEVRRNLIMTPSVALRSPPRDIETVGLSRERYAAYLELFDRLGLGVGVARSGWGTWFEAQGPSFANGATRKGYIYSDRDLTPVLASLDSVPRSLRVEGGVVLRRIKEHWYLRMSYE